MALTVSETRVQSILTRTCGYLSRVTSHSLQPYRGCSFGKALCGIGCYVRHNYFVTRGRTWGDFLEVRTNAAEAYRRQFARERDWARRHAGRFTIFLSSSTEPFLPQERRYRITHAVLEAMLERPPDLLVLQTHSHRIIDALDLLHQLSRQRCLRVHISIESDRDTLPGLPPPASTVDQRFEAAARLSDAGVPVVITVSPLLPIAEPAVFFRRIGDVADAVVLDHFIEGDGSPNGTRTARTALPAAIAAVEPQALTLDYRERMLAVAQQYLPGRVGVSVDGFAGRYLA